MNPSPPSPRRLPFLTLLPACLLGLAVVWLVHLLRPRRPLPQDGRGPAAGGRRPDRKTRGGTTGDDGLKVVTDPP